jgi:hypothetical protein
MEDKLFPDVGKVRRRMKMLTTILIFSVVVNILFLVFAYVQKQQADRAEEYAMRAKEEAVASKNFAEHALEGQVKMLRDSLVMVKAEVQSLRSKSTE